jgi:hypothetical protein
MTLGEFHDYISSYPDGTIFPFGVSAPFSWRGSYDEVAFKVLSTPMSRGNVLARIDLALTEEFQGWKGGEYRYERYTDVHFEDHGGACSSGEYTAEWIARIEGGPVYKSQEERLVKLAFRPTEGS